MHDNLSDVAAHYHHASLIQTIDAGLETLGVDPTAPTIGDLAPIDEFHSMGREGTMAALELLDPKPGSYILDAGCGLGGAARLLAVDYQCDVAGIDATPEYVAAAKELTARLGLSAKCRFTTGSVTSLPYENSMFDSAITFHVGMNVPGRDRFYGEVARALKPAGRFCLFDVMKGPAEGVPYPMPWAETAAASHLRTREETGSLLEQAGFDIVAERNLRQEATNYFREALTRTKAHGPAPLGLHQLTGDNAGEKFVNILEAYAAAQIEPVILIARLR